MGTAHGVDATDPCQDAGRRIAVVVLRARDGAGGEDAGVEHAPEHHADPPFRCELEERERRLLEERIAAGQHHAVDVGFAGEARADRGVVDAEADRPHHALRTQLDERLPRPVLHLADAGVERVPVRPRVEVVHERDVHRRDAEPEQRLLERAQAAVAAVVEAALERQAADVAAAVAHARGCRGVDAPHFRGQHEARARPPPQRGADAVLGQPAPVQRCGVEQRDAGVRRRRDRGDRRGVVERAVEVAERRAAETECRHGDGAAAEHARRQGGGWRGLGHRGAQRRWWTSRADMLPCRATPQQARRAPCRRCRCGGRSTPRNPPR